MQQAAPAASSTWATPCEATENNQSSSVAEVRMYTSTTTPPASSSRAAGGLEQRDSGSNPQAQPTAGSPHGTGTPYDNGSANHLPGTNRVDRSPPQGTGETSFDTGGNGDFTATFIVNGNEVPNGSKNMTGRRNMNNINTTPSNSETACDSGRKVPGGPRRVSPVLEEEGASSLSDVHNSARGGSGFILPALEAASHQMGRMADAQGSHRYDIDQNNIAPQNSNISSKACVRSDLANVNAPADLLTGERLRRPGSNEDSTIPRRFSVEGGAPISGSFPSSKRVDAIAPMSGGDDAVNGGLRRRPGATAPVDIKLFVGRLPPNATEKMIVPLFSRFGTVLEAVIIRDKATNTHRGSCFVRMASITDADAAIRHLHNTRIPLGTRKGEHDAPVEQDPSQQPIQISYAFGEPERLGFTPGALRPGDDEAKLFIGSLPRDATEQSVGMFFRQFGRCFDPFLILDGARQFRGCGFIKFALKEEALQAIRQLHGVAVFPGASRPLELRIAEPRKSAIAGRGVPQQHPVAAGATVGGSSARFGQQQQQPWGTAPRQAIASASRYLGMQDVGVPTAGRFMGSGVPGLEPGAVAAMMGCSAYGQLGRRSGSKSFVGREGSRMNSATGPMGMGLEVGTSRDLYDDVDGGFGNSPDATGDSAYLRLGTNGVYTDQSFRSIFNPNYNPRAVGPWREYYASDGRVYYHNESTGTTQWEVPPEFAQLTMMMMMMSPHQQQDQSAASSAAAGSANGSSGAAPGRRGYQQLFSDVTGPPGANIFVFHLPNSWTREDLVGYFEPFGTILSAKVALDYVSRRNKGYGFVSYSSIDAAIRAVQQMNLVSIGAKRLRVAIKSGEEEQARLFAQGHGIPFPPSTTVRPGGASALSSSIRNRGIVDGGGLNRRSTIASQQALAPQQQQLQALTATASRHGPSPSAFAEFNGAGPEPVAAAMGLAARFPSDENSAMGKMASGLELHSSGGTARPSNHESAASNLGGLPETSQAKD